MEYREYSIIYKSRKDQFTIYPIGDIHAGTVHCAESEIKKLVKAIGEDPLALWIGMGDYGDLITPHDPRWDIEVISPWVERSNVAESQRVWLRNLLKPIAPKCIGLLGGNHEDSIRRYNAQDIHLDLCRDLSVPYLGYSCFIRFLFKRVRAEGEVHSFVGVFQHGSGAAQTEGGKIMRLKKLMDSFDADIYAMGHLHDIVTDSLAQLYPDQSGKIKQKIRVGAITGSWMRTYSQGLRPNYAEMRGYYPTMIGCPRFLVSPDKRILKVMV